MPKSGQRFIQYWVFVQTLNKKLRWLLLEIVIKIRWYKKYLAMMINYDVFVFPIFTRYRGLRKQDFGKIPCKSLSLKVQSCTWYNNKYMIVSTQIPNTEIVAFIAALVCKLLSRNVLFINRKDDRKSKK